MFKMKKSLLVCAFALLLGSETQASFGGDYVNSSMLATVAVGAGATAFVKGMLGWYNQLGLKAAQEASELAAQKAAKSATDDSTSELALAKSKLAEAAAQEATQVFEQSKSQLFLSKLQLPKQTIGFAAVGVAFFLIAQQLDSNKTLQGLLVEACLSTTEKIIGTKNATSIQATFAGILGAASLRIPS
jgi:hypothetical protein